jgi:hypothetical protein
MKSLKLQIEFIDKKLLVLYGFNSIIDYSHSICIGNPESIPIDLSKLNGLIDDFRKIFHAKNFSLHKTQYKIQTKSQAVCLLKTCLEITSVPFDISLKQKKKYLRLISKNNILDDYINTHKMSENRIFQENILKESNEYNLPNEYTSYMTSKPDKNMFVSSKNSDIQYIQTNFLPLFPTPFADINSNIGNEINSNNNEIRSEPPSSNTYIQPFLSNSLLMDENNKNKENKKNNNYEIRSELPERGTIDRPFLSVESGLKEYIKPNYITKEVLNNSIKKITQFEYYANPKYMFNGMSLQINMKKYNLADKILKSFCVKFVSKELDSKPIISEHFIEQLTKNIKFIVEFGCSRYQSWSSSFINGSNVILDNIIIPLNCLEHHSVIFHLENLEQIKNLLENLELVISGEFVDLYSEIETNLKNSFIEQTICVGEKYNLLRILSGMAGFAYAEYMSLDKFNYFTKQTKSWELTNLELQKLSLKKINKNEITKESNIFVGNPLIIGEIKGNKIEGYEITDFKMGYNIKYINKALSYGFDFVCWKKCESFEKIDNYYREKISKNKFSHNYKLKICDDNRFGCDISDSINLIEILINVNPKNYNELNLFYYKNDIKINHKINYNLFEGTIKVCFDKKYLNTINKLSYICLNFITNYTDEPVVGKIMLLTRKFIWSSVYENKIQNNFKDKLEFTIDELVIINNK